MLKVFFQTFSTNEKAPVDTQAVPQTTAILSTLEVIMNRLSFRSFSFQAVFGSKYLPVCKMKTTASPKRSRLFRNYALFFVFLLQYGRFRRRLWCSNSHEKPNSAHKWQWKLSIQPWKHPKLGMFRLRQVHVWEGGSRLVRLRVSVGHFKEICFIAKTQECLLSKCKFAYLRAGDVKVKTKKHLWAF